MKNPAELPEAGEDVPIAGFARQSEDGTHVIELLVEGAHCAACIGSIEGAVRCDPAVKSVRLNLTLRRLSITWHGVAGDADRFAQAVRRAGYRAVPFLPDALAAADDEAGRELIKALGVVAFAGTNVMMIAIAIWAGQAQDMNQGTQLFLQWISGLVAVPAVLYGARPFYRSAWRALAAGTTNIDVPIAAGVFLTTIMSLIELARHGRNVYFDSALALLLVLLIGRLLDHRVRAKARGAIEQLLMLKARGALLRHENGSLEIVPADQVPVGALVLVRPGERVPADGVVEQGVSSLDGSIVTGETRQVAAEPGSALLAGMLNGGGALEMRVTVPAEQSHLSEIVRLVELAEQRRGRAVMLADRLTRIWTPAIHLLALGTFLGWVLAGHDVFTSLVAAVSVLIVACPCALGLAVPTVHVVAAGALMRAGVLLRSGDALERLAEVDRVVLDKTGTITEGRLQLIALPGDQEAGPIAASLAAASSHPAARAIAAAFPHVTARAGVVEVAGEGLIAGDIRLGSRGFCGLPIDPFAGTEVWLTRRGADPACFPLADRARADAAATIRSLYDAGLELRLLSGDAPDEVARIAREVGIADACGGLRPAAKLAALETWRGNGHKVLMVGDGLNDAPSLAGAYVSASFTHGAAASQAAADLVLPGEKLGALLIAYRCARRVRTIVRQNFAAAVVYNVLLVPFAMAGVVTPLFAAIFMSLSSLTVTLNALRAGSSKGAAA